VTSSAEKPVFRLLWDTAAALAPTAERTPRKAFETCEQCSGASNLGIGGDPDGPEAVVDGWVVVVMPWWVYPS
jgi:hypothetical protein